MKKPIISLLVLCLAFFLSSNETLAQSNENQAILLRSGVVLLPENAASFDQKDVLYKSEVVGDHFYRLIQFTQIPSADQHRALEEAGIQLLDYIPHKAYIAALPTSIQASQLQALGIRSLMPIPQNLKMADNLRDRPFPEWALKKGKVDAMLKYYSSIPVADILAFCRADGIEVVRHNGLNNFLRVAIAEDRLETVSALPYVAYLELAPSPGEPDDVPGRGLHRSNVIDTEFLSGRHYTGEDVKVLVRDDGIVGPHIDFHGRISQEDVNGDGGINHADGVAGIFAGAGNRNPRIRGMAAGAFIYVINYQADFLDNTLPLHIDSDVLVTNSSYSNGCNDGYTAAAVTVDQQLYNYPTFMHVFSAGNSNNQNCDYGAGNQWGNITGGHKQAKNAIATANVTEDGTLVNSSSRGPAYDGRLKPDISANGGSQFSTDPDNEYSAFSGTSAAAPGIAGVTAQLHQAYREANPGEIAEGALLKAIMLNTANDLGNPGPDFRFGWGHVNAYRAALAIEEDRFFSGTIDQDGANTHQISIPDGVKQAKIMVYWSDKEGSELALKALVANLDAQVANENGDVFQPLVLDPTPDQAILNLPAVPGVDSLNNMEQVSLTEPSAGEYTLTVSGTEVPFAGQKYWVVYEFITDEITVTYPIGGEGLVPGEAEIIHWDTYGEEGDFLLEYSVDSMATWTAIGTLNGTARLYNWIVPGAVVTGKAFVRVTRDTVAGQSQQPFSIVEVPANLEVTQACPEFIRLEWDSVPGATAYDVFLLGELYMDSIATTSELLFDVPAINFNPTLDHWLSVRAVGEEGVRGRRAVAIPWNAGLLNCPLDNDLAVTEITSPPALLTSCGSLDIEISVNVINNGATEQTDAQVTYQIGTEDPVTETLAGPIPVGGNIPYTFTTLATLGGPGNFDLKTWVTPFDGIDQASFNDTLIQPISAIIYPGDGAAIGVIETFEGGIIPPEYWQISNPDNGYTFEARADITGADGQPTTAMWINNYDYSSSGEEDDLVTLPIDLSDANENTMLTFDLAYSVYNLNQYWDALRVDVYTDCGDTFAGTVYYKAKDTLATVPPQTQPFTPSSGDQWRKETVSLADFAGESVVIHFVNITGYGNSLFIDNINVDNFILPEAGLLVSETVICPGYTVTFQDNSQGNGLTYQWSFGSGAIPANATGPGPHIVQYNAAGMQTATLSVFDGTFTDIATQDIEVGNLPSASFSYNNQNGEVTFTNNSIFGQSYSWNFGDGDTSNVANPVHVYTESGTYQVTLAVTNDCGTVQFGTTINVVINGVNELALDQAVQIVPNPNKGLFEVMLEGIQDKDIQFRVLDMTGKQLWSRDVEASPHFRQSIDLTTHPKGVYWLVVQTDQAVQAFKVVVQ